MGLGGIFARLATLGEHKYDMRCSRCSLYYNTKTTDECPHYGELNDARLDVLRRQRLAEREANKRLGTYFFLIAAGILSIAVMVVLAS